MIKGKHKKSIKYSLERVVLGDVLPYETPIIFSNRYFYDFLVKYIVKYVPDNNPKITWKKCQYDEVLEIPVFVGLAFRRSSGQHSGKHSDTYSGDYSDKMRIFCRNHFKN